MRETRTEICALKELKITIFKERFVKKIHTHLSSQPLKKLHRYKNTQQSGDGKFCGSFKPDCLELAQVAVEDKFDNTITPISPYELNHMEL